MPLPVKNTLSSFFAQFFSFFYTRRDKIWVFLPYFWYALMLLGPLLTMLFLSVCEFDVGIPPYKPLARWVDHGILQIRLCLANYAIVFQDPFYLTAFINSLTIAFLATLGCLFIGYPMAYGISQSKRPLVWLMLAILPFFTSFLVRVYAWMTLLSPQGLINQALIGLNCQPLSLINTQGAVIVGVVYSYLPFMIFPLYAVMDKIDRHLLEAAYDLGCRPFSAFWRITVPLSRSGIIAGASLVFIPALGEYLIPELLGGPTSLTIGRLVWYEFFANRDWPLAAAIAVSMIMFLGIPIWLFEKLTHIFQEQE